MSEASNTVAEFLSNHPRMVGVLFAAFVLLNSSQSVMAGFAATSTGP